MSTLYELTGERLALQAKLESLNLDEETIADTLEGESLEISKKIEAYGFVIRNRRSLVEAMDAEIERMQARRDAEDKRIKATEKWLLDSMVACGITKIECPAFTVATQANPASVNVVDESAIPPEYICIPEPKPPVPAPDKRAILAALKSGKDVPGCAIKNTFRLVIK